MRKQVIKTGIKHKFSVFTPPTPFNLHSLTFGYRREKKNQSSLSVSETIKKRQNSVKLLPRLPLPTLVCVDCVMGERDGAAHSVAVAHHVAEQPMGTSRFGNSDKAGEHLVSTSMGLQTSDLLWSTASLKSRVGGARAGLEQFHKLID